MAYISHDAGHVAGRRSSATNFVAIAFALVGVSLAAAGVTRLAGLPWTEVATSVSARSWPTADARIVSASLEEVRVPTPEGITSELALMVRYEFETAGGTVLAATASLSDRSGPEDRRLLSLYRRIEFARVMGRTMPASYDPADPSRAFLDAKLPWGGVLPGLGFGALLVCLGGSFLARAVQWAAHSRH